MLYAHYSAPVSSTEVECPTADAAANAELVLAAGDFVVQHPIVRATPLQNETAPKGIEFQNETQYCEPSGPLQHF